MPQLEGTNPGISLRACYTIPDTDMPYAPTSSSSPARSLSLRFARFDSEEEGPVARAGSVGHVMTQAEARSRSRLEPEGEAAVSEP